MRKNGIGPSVKHDKGLRLRTTRAGLRLTHTERLSRHRIPGHEQSHPQPGCKRRSTKRSCSTNRLRVSIVDDGGHVLLQLRHPRATIASGEKRLRQGSNGCPARRRHWEPTLPRAHSSQRSSVVSPGPSPCFLEVWSCAIRRVRSSTPAKALTQQRTRGSPQQLAQLLPPTSDRRPRQGDPRTNLSRWAKPSLALISPRRRCTPSRRSKVRRKPTSRFGPIAQRSRRAAPGARS